MAEYTGTSGNDSYSGTESDDTISGAAGNDALLGLGGNDSISGGAGQDSIHGGLGNDTLDGGANDAGFIGDWVGYTDAGLAGFTTGVNVNFATNSATGAFGTDTITGFEGVQGTEFDDTLTGSSAAEWFIGGLGNDIIDGGGGFDYVDYSTSAVAVTVNLATKTSSGAHGADSLNNIEAIRGSTAADTLTGDGGNNTIRGQAGDDVLDGGDGFDTADYIAAAASVTVNLLTGSSSGGDGVDSLTAFESIRGSSHNDTLIGDSSGNNISGGAGSDAVQGGGGNDTLDGSAGTDTVEGQTGNDYIQAGDGAADTIDGGDGHDIVAYSFGVTTPVTFTSTLNTGTQADGVAADTISNVEELHVFGGSGNDNLAGGAERNYLMGNGGNDTLTGGAGNDTFNFNVGIAGGNGTDRITDLQSADNLSFNNSSTGVHPILDATILSGDDASGLTKGQVMIGSASGGLTKIFVGLDDTQGVDLTVELQGTYLASDFNVVNAGFGASLNYFVPAITVNELQLKSGDPTQTVDGNKVADQFHFAWTNGTAGNDTFTAATDVTAGTLALMATHGRGMFVQLGAGNDKATGTGYGDNFDMGLGTNYVDGGANAGTTPWGARATDTLDLYVADQAAANAVTVTGLDGSTGSTEENAAHGLGYTAKVVAGAQVNYIKGIEHINIQVWDDKNSDGQKDWGTEVMPGSRYDLAPNVLEHTGDLATQFHAGSVNGTLFGDNLNLAHGSLLIPAALAATMSAYQRGLFVQAGGGNDTIMGTAFGDGINAGSGTNFVDGGTQIGGTPNSANPARDTLNVVVGSNIEAAAVNVSVLTGVAGLSGDDLTAQQGNYRYKVVSSATGEIDYVKDIETLNIQVFTDLNSNGRNDFGAELVNYRTRALGPTVTDNVPSLTNLTPSLGFVFGTQFNDTLTTSSMFAALGKTFDSANPFGAFIFALGGSDVVTGTDGTDFVLVSHTSATTSSTGSHLVDGGADAGYYSFSGTGGPVISADTYRLLEQRVSEEVPNHAVPNGGLTSSDFQSSKYRLVNLTKWSAFAGSSLDQMTGAAATELINMIDGLTLSTNDAANIGTVAGQLGLTSLGGGGYTMAVIKYGNDGTALLGVDFLKDIEAVQLGLWFDFNRNDVANGGSPSESVIWGTYSVRQDNYTLAESQKSWLDLTFSQGVRPFSGIVNGTTAAETLDASVLAIPGYMTAGTGWRIGDLNGNDNVIGSIGNDVFALGAGNDTINGGDGNDVASIFWSPGTNKGTATLTSTKTLLGGITTITVTQNNSEGALDLLTLVNNGSDSQWTLSTTGAGADVYLRPSGGTTAGVGLDLLSNIETLAIYLQAPATGTTTGAVGIATPLEVQLVGLVI